MEKKYLSFSYIKVWYFKKFAYLCSGKQRVP